MYEFEHVRMFLILLNEVRLIKSCIVLLVLFSFCRYENLVMSPCMQNEQNLTSVIDKTNRYLRYMKLATIKGRISSSGASRSMLSRTYARCTLFLLRPGLFFPTGFLLPGKVFNETTNKRVQHHIIHWWTSKGIVVNIIIYVDVFVNTH